MGPCWAWPVPPHLGDCVPDPSCVEPQWPTAPGRLHSTSLHTAASATGKPSRAVGHLVPVEAAAGPRPAEGRKSWEQSPSQPGQHLIRRPKVGGGISGTMLFMFLFLNKSEVSGGTNEVIRKDVSGIKPPASRLRRALGTRRLEKLRWGLFILDSVTQAWDQGARQTCPQALHSLFPWVPPGNLGASSALKMVPSVSSAAG